MRTPFGPLVPPLCPDRCGDSGRVQPERRGPADPARPLRIPTYRCRHGARARTPGRLTMAVHETTTPSRLDRWSGACWVAAGLLLLGGVLHPDVSETTFAAAALDTPLWVPMHAAATVAVVLSLFGLTGLYARRAERLGRLGAVGFALAVPGLVMAACIAYAEAFLLPVIAADTPEAFGWDGPVVTSWAVRATAGVALLWLVG